MVFGDLYFNAVGYKCRDIRRGYIVDHRLLYLENKALTSQLWFVNNKVSNNLKEKESTI